MSPEHMMKKIEIKSERDIVKVRNAVYKVSQNIGLSQFNRTKVATAASELARNIIEYAGKGNMMIVTLTQGKKGVQIIARDNGPGIDNVEEILKGNYRSESGMGMGLIGAKRLSDEFKIKTGSEGTSVFLTKHL